MEDAQEQLGQVSDHNSKLKAELEAASTELAAVEEFANRRWVNAQPQVRSLIDLNAYSYSYSTWPGKAEQPTREPEAHGVQATNPFNCLQSKFT
jgi:hypothetical protein